jgi:hypothetical protein
MYEVWQNLWRLRCDTPRGLSECALHIKRAKPNARLRGKDHDGGQAAWVKFYEQDIDGKSQLSPNYFYHPA